MYYVIRGNVYAYKKFGQVVSTQTPRLNFDNIVYEFYFVKTLQQNS